MTRRGGSMQAETNEDMHVVAIMVTTTMNEAMRQWKYRLRRCSGWKWSKWRRSKMEVMLKICSD
ncbi:hypothetical protein U1Q18_028222, partial [Sarracenia purpurea var. burkii]